MDSRLHQLAINCSTLATSKISEINQILMRACNHTHPCLLTCQLKIPKEGRSALIALSHTNLLLLFRNLLKKNMERTRASKIVTFHAIYVVKCKSLT